MPHLPPFNIVQSIDPTLPWSSQAVALHHLCTFLRAETSAFQGAAAASPALPLRSSFSSTDSELAHDHPVLRGLLLHGGNILFRHGPHLGFGKRQNFAA